MGSKTIYDILIVDDEPRICSSLMRTLRQHDRRIVTANNAEEALARLRCQSFDLIISDFKMPGMDGITLLEQARRRWPDMLRMMISANSDRQMLMDLVNRAAVFQFLTKPWDSDTLQDVVNQALLEREAILERGKVQLQLEKASMEIVMALAETIELKDPYTKGHCSRVRDYCLMMAGRIGLPREMLPHLVYGSLLHDCGKIGIREDILLSKAPFDDHSRKIMETHSVLGFQLTNKIDRLKTASLFIRQHHERWDGNGYPDGLKGEQIHICSRIIAIADAFDAMTSDRPYHKAMPVASAIEIVRNNRGSQFDPVMADTFVSAMESGAALCMTTGHEDCASAGAPRILLVDDEIYVIKSLVRCLMDEGYQFKTATSGAEALEMLGREPVDIIVSDQRMPEMTGLEFLKKSGEACPDAIRIMLSGHTDICTDMEAVNEAGLYKLMTKPWDEDDLKHSLKNALEWRQMVRRNIAWLN